MKYKYKGFIPQNIAPKGAKNITFFNGNGEKVYTCGLGKMTHPTGTKLYSFGHISDLHIVENGLGVTWNPSTKLDNILTYFESENCAFCSHDGDTTNRGFYLESGTLATNQFEEYKRICDLHNIPVYGVMGNHDSYFKAITESLAELQTYTGHGLHYTITQGNDIHIFIGQSASGTPMTDDALQWLYETLETNRNKRCFIHVHPYLDCGNANSLYGNDVFSWWGTKTTAFKNLLKHYKNTILFHGHSHNAFECQEVDKTANYNESTGFRSVHTPSNSRPTFIVDGIRTTDDSKSYGYLVDVYNNYIVLNGRDFINGEWIPTGVIKIDTTLVNIEANTFTDSTGTITT